MKSTSRSRLSDGTGRALKLARGQPMHQGGQQFGRFAVVRKQFEVALMRRRIRIDHDRRLRDQFRRLKKIRREPRGGCGASRRAQDRQIDLGQNLQRQTDGVHGHPEP